MQRFTVVRAMQVNADTAEEAAEAAYGEMQEDDGAIMYVTTDLKFEDRVLSDLSAVSVHKGGDADDLGDGPIEDDENDFVDEEDEDEASG